MAITGGTLRPPRTRVSLLHRAGPSAARVILLGEAAVLVLIGFNYVATRSSPVVIAIAFVGAPVLVAGGLRIRATDNARPERTAGGRVPWDWTDFLMFWPSAFTAATILVSLGVPLADAASAGADATVRTAIESSVAQVAFYAGALFNIAVLAGMRRAATMADIGWRRFSWWWIPIAVAAAYVTLVVADRLQLVSQHLFPSAQNTQCVAVQHEYGHLIVLAIIVVCFVAPLSEETIFRGFTLGWLQRWSPAAVAIPISGIIFAALHGVLLLFIPLWFVGCVLAVLFWGSRSLWPGALVHGLFNLPGIIAILSTPTC